MSLSFDATFYQAQRPDVYDAFVATAGSTGLTWAQFAQNHYDSFGRFEGSDPSGSFSTSYYLSTYPDVAAAGVNPFDHFLSNGSLEQRVPYSTFPASEFVPATYAAANPDLAAAGLTTDGQLYQHWVIHGQFEGRTGAPTVVSPGVEGVTVALTTGADAPSLTTNNDTINGVTGSGVATTDTYTAGDSIIDASTTDSDVMNLTVAGTTASPLVTVTNVERVNLNNAAVAQTFDAQLVTGANQIWGVTSATTATQTITNVQSLSTAVGLQGKGNLTASHDASLLTGSSDTISVAVASAGTSATARSTINVSNSNNVEGVNLITSGTNFFDINAGTGTKTLTVTGDGANTVGSITSNTALTLDASGSTGTNSFDMGANLTGTDTITGGSGADTVVANLTSATQVNPTMSGVETVTLDFDAAGIFNGANATGLTNVNIAGSSANATVSNLAATATTIGTTTSNTGTVSVSYASGAGTAAIYNTGNTGTTATAVSNAGTSFTNSASLTVNAAGNSTSALGGLTLSSSNTALTLNTAAAANDLNTGNLVGTGLQTITIGATAGDVTVGTVNNAGDGSALTGIAVTSTGGGDITIGNVDANSATASAFSSFSVTGEDNTVLSVGNIVGLTDKNTISTYNVTLGAEIGTSSIGVVTAEAIGDVAITLGASAAASTFNQGILTADTIGNMTLTVGKNATLTFDTDASGGGSQTVGNITATGEGAISYTATASGGADTIGTVDVSGLSGGSTVNLANFETGTTMTGGAGGDTFTGTAGADIISGGAGTDVLNGGAGADTITAGEGTDTANGGDGSDIITLTETTSAVDIVQFTGTLITSGTVNTDTVTGFATGTDDIAFGSAFLNGNSNFDNTNVSLGASNGFASGNDDDIYIVSDGASFNEAGVVTAAAAFSNAGSQEAVFIGDDASGNANIYYVNDSLDGNAGDVTAADVVLIGVLEGVSSASLTAGDFVASV